MVAVLSRMVKSIKEYGAEKAKKLHSKSLLEYLCWALLIFFAVFSIGALIFFQVMCSEVCNSHAEGTARLGAVAVQGDAVQSNDVQGNAVQGNDVQGNVVQSNAVAVVSQMPATAEPATTQAEAIILRSEYSKGYLKYMFPYEKRDVEVPKKMLDRSGEVMECVKGFNSMVRPLFSGDKVVVKYLLDTASRMPRLEEILKVAGLEYPKAKYFKVKKDLKYVLTRGYAGIPSGETDIDDDGGDESNDYYLNEYYVDHKEQKRAQNDDPEFGKKANDDAIAFGEDYVNWNGFLSGKPVDFEKRKYVMHDGFFVRAPEVKDDQSELGKRCGNGDEKINHVPETSTRSEEIEKGNDERQAKEKSPGFSIKFTIEKVDAAPKQFDEEETPGIHSQIVKIEHKTAETKPGDEGEFDAGKMLVPSGKIGQNAEVFDEGGLDIEGHELDSDISDLDDEEEDEEASGDGVVTFILKRASEADAAKIKKHV